MGSCWSGNLGASKGQFQKLTARAKTSVASPSEVRVLCSGQLPSTSRSSSMTVFAVLNEHMSVFHMVVAALWGQSSVSGEILATAPWPGQQQGPELAVSPASAHCSSPAAPRQPTRVGTGP